MRSSVEVPTDGDKVPVVATQPAALVSQPMAAPGAPPKRVRALLLLNVFAASLYLAWWLVPGRIGTPALFWALVGAEAFSFIHLAGLWWTVWATVPTRPPPRRGTFSVDVVITACGESLETLEETITAAVAMRHPHRTLVLDDARDPRVRLLAHRLGAGYLTRSSNTGAKAGNLNNAMSRLDGELVAVFDADHAPRRDFLVRLLGYFLDPEIAFVQTPQYYRNAPDNAVARGALDQQVIFYGPICRGKSGLNAAFCCGTNVIFRRAAIDDVGGFDEDSVVEDLVTSMRMHRRGWKSVYHPHILAAGLGPDTIAAYTRQQFRWARGAIGALMSGEPFRRGYTLRQRIQYLLATSFYLTGFATIVYVALPFLYAFGGWSAFSARSSSFVFFYAPYLMLSMATIRWGLGKDLQIRHLRFTFGSFPAYVGAGLAAIFRVPARFHATGRSGGHHQVSFAAIVTLVAFLANVAAFVGALILQPFDPRTVTTMSWAAMNVMLLSGVGVLALRGLFPGWAKATVLVPRRRGASRPTVLTGAPTLPDRIREPAPVHVVPDAGSLRAAIVLLTAAGAALRVAFIGAQSLRLDESLSLRQAGLGLDALWKYLATSNVHVPLYHTILHAWIQVAGTSEIALRVPSVVAGTLAIPLLYGVTRRIAGPRTAIVAAAIGAGSPFWVWHSDEARMYPLLLSVTLASTLLFLRAVEVPRLRRWVAYGLMTGVALYAHYFAALLPLIHVAYLVTFRPGRRVVLSWLGASALSGVMFAPWVAAVWISRLGPEGLTSMSSGVRLAQPEYSFFGLLYGLVAFFAVYFVGYHGVGVLAYVAGVLAGMWPIAIMRTSARGPGEPGSRRVIGFLVAWIGLAVGVAFGLNVVLPGLLVQKYLILASPPLFILAARGLHRVMGAGYRRVAIVFAVLAATAIVQNAQPMNPLREDFRTASALVRDDGVPGEPVFVFPRYNATPLRYYHDGQIEALLGPDQPPAAAVAHLEAFATGHRGATFWAVSLYAENADPHGMVRRYLTRSFDRLASYRVGARMEVSRHRIPAIA